MEESPEAQHLQGLEPPPPLRRDCTERLRLRSAAIAGAWAEEPPATTVA